MSTISLRLPESLHQSARDLAKKEKISINQLITSALAEKISALLTEDYLQDKGNRSSRRKYLRVLNKVRNVEPAAIDKL